MSKNNAKGLTTLRQRVRRYIRDNFKIEIAAYKENPDDGESEEGKKKPFQSKIYLTGDCTVTLQKIILNYACR